MDRLWYAAILARDCGDKETTRRERRSSGRESWCSIVVATSRVDCWDIRIDSADVMHPL